MNGNQEDSATVAQDEQDDFSAAMAEFSRESDAPSGQEADGTKQEDQEQGTEVTPSSTAVQPTPVDPQMPAAGDPAPTGALSDDIWKDAPPALRDAYEKSQNENRSLRGRVSAADRRLNDVLRAGQQQGNEQGEGQQQQPKAKAKDLLGSDKAKRFEEDYPDIAEVVLPALQMLAEGQDQLAAPVDVLTAHALDDDQQRRIEHYSTEHPDWQDWAHDPRWGAFNEQAPRAVREALARNQNIEDPQEAAWVLGEFKKWAGGAPQDAQGNPLAAATPPASEQPKPAPNARRQRQMDAGLDGGSSGTGAAISGVPDDIDAAMAHYAAQADKRAASR